MTIRRRLLPGVTVALSAIAGGIASAQTETNDVPRLLTALAECDGKKLFEPCAARDAWTKAVEATDATALDDAGKAARRQSAASCVAHVSHGSPSARAAAAMCVGHFGDHVADRRQAARALLAQYAVDTSADARDAQLGALRDLDPTALGITPDVVARARPLVGRPSVERELARLVGLLRPSPFGRDQTSAPEAVAFVVELVRARVAVGEALGVLEKAKAPGPDVCGALLDLAETKRGRWAEAIEALGADGDRCRAERGRAAQIVLEVAKRPSGPARALGLAAHAAALARYVQDGAPSAEERAPLREALKLAEASDDAAALERLRDALEPK